MVVFNPISSWLSLRDGDDDILAGRYFEGVQFAAGFCFKVDIYFVRCVSEIFHQPMAPEIAQVCNISSDDEGNDGAVLSSSPSRGKFWDCHSDAEEDDEQVQFQNVGRDAPDCTAGIVKNTSPVSLLSPSPSPAAMLDARIVHDPILQRKKTQGFARKPWVGALPKVGSRPKAFVLAADLSIMAGGYCSPAKLPPPKVMSGKGPPPAGASHAPLPSGASASQRPLQQSAHQGNQLAARGMTQGSRPPAQVPRNLQQQGAGGSGGPETNQGQSRSRWGDDGVGAYGHGQHRGASSAGGGRGAWQGPPGNFVQGVAGPSHPKRGGYRQNWAARGGGRKSKHSLPTPEVLEPIAEVQVQGRSGSPAAALLPGPGDAEGPTQLKDSTIVKSDGGDRPSKWARKKEKMTCYRCGGAGMSAPVTQVRFGSLEPASAPARFVASARDAGLGRKVRLSIPGKQRSSMALQPSSPVIGLPSVSLEQYFAKAKGDSMLPQQVEPGMAVDATVEEHDLQGGGQGVTSQSVGAVATSAGVPDAPTDVLVAADALAQVEPCKQSKRGVQHPAFQQLAHLTAGQRQYHARKAAVPYDPAKQRSSTGARGEDGEAPVVGWRRRWSPPDRIGAAAAEIEAEGGAVQAALGAGSGVGCEPVAGAGWLDCGWWVKDK
ncbi:hypothetical protein ZWY2020_023678 [Hordeum vulgare]|nr:hypothetical protein ZWY2020_023678 [Hordeum vulgare]